ncbi:transcription initiation protein [Phycicoccus sp. CSK15P-2]|uniref:YciI family protein n=1 Tax=Phycicoccus sp. CSK15P-2 TaxID=2807627 RepID=UPI0019524F59|nr:YciI family protein [Phycicoccus sp. CSK15P-2]MBM6404453.1 transcription initiation protein [Phycicoccus sp. CSK15P-2]
MTEYVVLIVGDADRWWTTMDVDQRTAGYAEYARFGEELTRRGHTITGGAELHATSEAKRIPPGGGPVTDGPFTETAEQVGGFYLVQSEDLDDLLDCCSIIAALGDGIEVRRTVQPEDRPS